MKVTIIIGLKERSFEINSSYSKNGYTFFQNNDQLYNGFILGEFIICPIYYKDGKYRIRIYRKNIKLFNKLKPNNEDPNKDILVYIEDGELKILYYTKSQNVVINFTNKDTKYPKKYEDIELVTNEGILLNDKRKLKSAEYILNVVDLQKINQLQTDTVQLSKNTYIFAYVNPQGKKELVIYNENSEIIDAKYIITNYGVLYETRVRFRLFYSEKTVSGSGKRIIVTGFIPSFEKKEVKTLNCKQIRPYTIYNM